MSDPRGPKKMVKKPMSVELLHRVKALKKQGFDVFFTSDSDGVILNIRKKRSRVPFTQS
jgi:hypothetical protein